MIMIKERIGKLVDDIKELIYKESVPITKYKTIRSMEKFENIDSINTDNWSELTNEQLWGGHREYFWFETFVTIPENFDGKCVVYELRTGKEGEWDATNPQFSAYVNGKRIQGLDVNHREIILSENAKKGETYRIILSAFTGDQNFKLIMDSEIKILDRETEKYYYDISVPYNVARLLDNSDGNSIKIIQTLNESLNLLDLRVEYSKEYYESLKKAQKYVTEEFYNKYCGHSDELVYCVGHTHIDVAWLWTLAVTEDKSVRSFSTVLELMRQYPEYVFMSSQPQLYKYVKKNAPEVYEEIKARVAEGRWETEGGMFVEADCNLSSGESLVRQLVYGKKFFKEEFGKDNEILWLPDVFGYSAALPQIMKKCGIKYFMTTKISWNEFNKMPYDTFEWEGIDGTRILTHFSPSRDYKKAAVEGGTETEHYTTYNAFTNPLQVKGAWARYSQKHLNNEVLMSFGFGDGGGGPTKDMLENQRRVGTGIPGCPRTVMSTAKNFFLNLDKNVRDNKYLPTWVGELYLEYHRGTYTSMARNKKSNRKSEILLANAETFSMLDSLLNKGAYPKDKIDDAWEIVLRNQFHDILPGSSIKEVYDDSKVEYEVVANMGNDIVNSSVANVVKNINTSKNNVVVFNNNSFVCEGVVSFVCPKGITNPVIVDGDKEICTQKTEDGSYIFIANGVPSKGYKSFGLKDGSSASTIKADKKTLENDFIKVLFHDNGQITSIFDKRENREVLKENKNANVIMTYEDRPHNFDAWDLNNYYEEKYWEVTDVTSMELVENGPVRATICVKRKYLNSTICQYISITNNSSEITFQNEVDWKEKLIMMKSLFPVDIHTDEATFEIQYGNVKRKTHKNTMWDFAKFEVCMHKWLDVSEDDYGVSLMNDCKYGCHVHDGEIGITMLKSAMYPNPEADKEHHSFTFSLYPHSGDWKKANTIKKAYNLNNPMSAIVKEEEGGSLDNNYSLVAVDSENVVIEVVKRAEDGDALVVRLYETFNKRTNVNMTFGFDFASIFECDMLENNENALEFKGRTATFSLKPYEIKTFKIQK